MITVSRHLALVGLAGSVVVALLLLSAGTAQRPDLQLARRQRVRLVVSDIPPTPDVPTVRVAGTESVRATRRVVVAECARAVSTALIDHHASNAPGCDPSSSARSSRSNRASTLSARSPVGAMGLMQLMPDTAAELGVRRSVRPRRQSAGRHALPETAARPLRRQRGARARRLQRRPRCRRALWQPGASLPRDASAISIGCGPRPACPASPPSRARPASTRDGSSSRGDVSPSTPTRPPRPVIYQPLAPKP